MRSKFFKLLMVVGLIAMCSIGCSKESGSKIALEKGILSWVSDEKAEYYEVSLGDKSIACEEEQLNLSTLCDYEGEHVISVSAVSEEGKKTEIGTLKITAKALQKPAVSIVESDSGETIFVWKTEKAAGGYEYNLNDGYGNRIAEIQDDQMCRIVAPDNHSRTFLITVKPSSEKDVFYIGNQTTCDYPGKTLFDMANLANYPFAFVSEGKWTEQLQVGTTLSKGVYDLEFSFYIMNTNGSSLSGIGLWGRRLTHTASAGNQYVWFCDGAVEGNQASKNTLRAANEQITCTLKDVKINKYGETTLTLNDFKIDEMLVVADIKLKGISVMASGLKERSEDEQSVFDTNNLEQFVAVYKSAGKWTEELVIPTTLKNGVYELEVAYQLMTADGKSVSDNGLYARRIADAEGGQNVYYCEYTVGEIAGKELPLPTQTLTSTFTVKVSNGEIKLYCLDFNQGEILAVSSVKKIKGSDFRFDMSSLSKYKNVYTRKTDGWTPDDFVIETTKKERKQLEVEITYYAVDSEGYMLTGNGMWGRRIVDDTNKFLWLCHTAPSEGNETAIGTIPEPDKLVTQTVTVTLNKQGKFSLTMQDFLQGETVIVTDVKYQGESIIEK